jgi:hypothetical protein
VVESEEQQQKMNSNKHGMASNGVALRTFNEDIDADRRLHTLRSGDDGGSVGGGEGRR